MIERMSSTKYSEEAGATDVGDYSVVQDRMARIDNSKFIHYALGVCTEVGELQDALKKHLIYGKEADRINVIEEVGDVLWYISRLLTLCESSFEEAFARNNAKLKARFGEKFTEHAALNRNLEAERKILETPVNANEQAN